MNNFIIDINFIFGFMIGFEFIPRQDKHDVASFVLDLGIVRIVVMHEVV
jgi:hypothetical protein